MDKKIDQAPRSLKKNEMIRSAYDIFYKNGFHATGVDAILEGTGISKRTLYKHFISKEGLIIAAIGHYHQIMLASIIKYIEKSPFESFLDKVLSIFDFLSEQVDGGNLNGCFAMNAKTEYVNKSKEIEMASEAYSIAQQQLIERYLHMQGLANSRSLAIQVLMLFEGAIVRSKSVGNSKPIHLAKVAAGLICR